MNSVCVIGVYFGKFSNYFNLWLLSCQYNPQIDFYIVTDQPIDRALPQNIHFIVKNLSEFSALAERKLQTHVELKRAYKCCDLKPFYGIILEDYIQNYKYWGHCDFDLIFGDLLYFMQEYNYTDYDKFLHLGHLSFYRNTNTINQYYKEAGSLCGDYKQVLANEKNVAFDEIPGIVSIYQKNKHSLFIKKIFADISSRHFRYCLSTFCILDGQKIKNYREQIFYWERGKVFRAYYWKGEMHIEEYMYIHFQRRPNYTVEFKPFQVMAFFITPYGFIPKDGPVTRRIIKQYNRRSMIPLYESYEYFKWYIANKQTDILKMKIKSK